MDILITIDNRNVMPAGVFMTSVAMNNEPGITFHILVNEEFLAENRTRLSEVAAQFGCTVQFYSISASQQALFPIGKQGMPGHISISAYNRLFVTEFLPTDVHRVLYMDPDMIVRKSLDELWNTNLDGYALAVVHDMSETGHFAKGRLNYSSEYGYFNSGLLLINLDYWRENNCFGRFMDFAREHWDLILLHDQDVLNYVLHAEKKWLPLTYNFQAGFLFDVPEMIDYPDSWNDEIRSIERDPAIIHYCGWSKPWNYNCMHPQRYVWHYYKAHSLFRDEKLAKPVSLKEAVVMFLKTNNYWLFEHHWDSRYRNIYRRVILRK